MGKSLYDRRWRARRARQLREHPLCKMHMDVLGILVAATIGDHITPHRGDPVLFEGPLQSLCKECHDNWKRQMDTSGHIKGCDVNGMPLDSGHGWRQEQKR